MTIEERRDSGLLDLNLDIHIDDFINLVAGFRPIKRSEFELSHPPFGSPFDSVRNEFPSGQLLSAHIKAIDLALFTTVDAVEVLSKRPGMPVPTFEQLAAAYVEIARRKGILNVLETAISSNLSSGAQTDADLFGVGSALAPTISHMIPPRCVPEQAKITLPESLSIDIAVAAHLLGRFVMERESIYFDSRPDDSFDAASTHTTNHGTVCVGATPFHSPNSFCFDNRALESATTNTELVIEHATQLGVPLDFTDGMVRLAKGDHANEFQFETEMINTFFGSCGSTTLAMKSTNLLLSNRFKPSEAFRVWREKRVNAVVAKFIGRQEHAPNLDNVFNPVPVADIDWSKFDSSK